MKGLLCILLWSALWSHRVCAQTASSSDVVHKGNSFEVFTIAVSDSSVRGIRMLSNGGQLPHHDFVKALPVKTPVFLINASVHDRQCRPMGWFVEQGIERQPVNHAEGYGNFFLKPNGIFAVLHSGEVLLQSSEVFIDESEVRFGVQSGPMLLIDGQAHPVFNPGSTNRNMRCGVALAEMDGVLHLVFALSKQPVTFFEFAMLFREKYGALNALCLESGGSVMHFPFLGSSSETRAQIVCNYISITLE